jgi:hypothetical protein
MFNNKKPAKESIVNTRKTKGQPRQVASSNAPAVAADEFIETLFAARPGHPSPRGGRGNVRAIYSNPVDIIENGKTKKVWPANPVTRRTKFRADYYVNWSTAKVIDYDDGKGPRVRAAKEAFGAQWFLMLDDIGDAKKSCLTIDDPRVQAASYLLETSAGNYQVGYLFDAPLGEVDSERLRQACIAAGLGDKGSLQNPHRWCRAPGSVNVKPGRNGFESRLVEWHPERRFTLDALADALGITLGAKLNGSAQRPNRKGLDYSKLDAIPDSRFQFLRSIKLGEKGSVLNARANADGFFPIICPWFDDRDHGHSGHDQSGSGYRPSMGGDDPPAFACHHSHGQTGLNDGPCGTAEFNRWVDAQRQQQLAQLDRKVGAARDTEPASEELPDPLDLWGAIALEAQHAPEGILPRTIHQLAHADPVVYPPHAMAMSALAAVATLASARIKVRITHSWVEAFLFWLGLYGGAGTGKTPVLDRAFGTLKPSQHTLDQRHAAQWEAWRALPGDTRKATPEPKRVALTTNNATIEAIGELLRDNPHGIGVKNNELTTVLAMIDGAYNKAALSQSGDWLALADAPSNFAAHRTGRGHIFAENWSAVLAGGITTAKLLALARDLVADGLLARLCMVEAPMRDPTTELGAAESPEVDQLCRIMRVLFVWRDSLESSVELALSPAAREVMGEAQFYWQTQAQLYRESLPRFAERMGKYVGYTARFALGFHLIEAAEAARQHGGAEAEALGFAIAGAAAPWRRDIEARTLERAFEFLKVQAQHDLRFYLTLAGSTVAPAHELAQSIAAWLLRSGRRGFGFTDLQQQCAAWKACGDQRLQHQALALLELMHWIEPTEESRALAPVGCFKGVFVRGYRWHVNPRAGVVFAERAAQARAAAEQVKAQIAASAAKRREEKAHG